MADEVGYYQLQIRRTNYTRTYNWIFRTVSQQAQQPPLSFINQVTICYLHVLCMNILIPNAGDYRIIQVYVSDYTPPPAERVPPLMKEFVEDLNKKWHSHDHIQIASFALWRLNWIHPFENGNGRTSRAFSYFLMSMKEKINFPVRGDYSIDNLLQNNFRREYVQALEEADNGNIAPLEQLLENLLKEQVDYARLRKL